MTRPPDGSCVIELPATGPVPLNAMMLADFGADEIRVDRHDKTIRDQRVDVLPRWCRSIVVDPKRPGGGASHGGALLSARLHDLWAPGEWRDERGTNSFDSGSLLYEVYETADHRFVSLGSLQPKFYRALLDALELAGARSSPAMRRRRARFRAIFRSRTQDERCRLLDGREVCFAAVLTTGDAPEHPPFLRAVRSWR